MSTYTFVSSTHWMLWIHVCSTIVNICRKHTTSFFIWCTKTTIKMSIASQSRIDAIRRTIVIKIIWILTMILITRALVSILITYAQKKLGSISLWHIFACAKWILLIIDVHSYAESLGYWLQKIPSLWFPNGNQCMFHLCCFFLKKNVWQPTLTASKFITVVSTVIVVVAHIGGISTPSIFTQDLIWIAGSWNKE